ncbi:MAG: sodium:calcium antiporter [Anaerolineaceae bacterium]|nr:sodium:calcium antiporter [Anaerolineaceae bacterium]
MFESIQIAATTGGWVWVTFVVAAALIVIAAMQLAKYGDVIAARTKLGGMFIGVLLLAGATSLPELLTSINSINMGAPELSAGNFFGSSAFNMFILAILDVAGRDQRVLRTSNKRHLVSGGFAVFICTLVIFLLVANPILTELNFNIGWVGVDSIIIMLFYVLAIYMIQQSEQETVSTEMTEEELADIPSLKVGLLGFTAAAVVLGIVCPFMVRAAEQISEITGLGTSFVGSSLVALVTSLPEMVTSISAISIGAADMALGNLFGSNMFNMFGIGIADVFYTKGRFLSTVDNPFIVVGMLGALMTAFGLLGNIVKFKRIGRIMDVDAAILTVLYFSGMYLLFVMSR